MEPENTLHWAILGTGRISSIFAAALRRLKNASVIAVAARKHDDSEEFAQRYEIPIAGAPYEEAFERDDIDIVYVGTPNSTHVELAAAALQAGKHVLCEKPLAPDADSASLLFDLAESAGLILSEGFMYRYHPQTHKLIEIAESGAIGDPRLVRSCYSFWLSSEEDIRFKAELQGGSLWDLGGYAVDISRQILGEPRRVVGECELTASAVDSSFYGIVTHDGGARSVFDCSFRLPMRRWVEVVGTLGSILVEDAFMPSEGVLQITTENGFRTITTPEIDLYATEAQAVMDAVHGSSDAALGRQDAVWNAATIASLYWSARSAKPAALPAQHESTEVGE